MFTLRQLKAITLYSLYIKKFYRSCPPSRLEHCQLHGMYSLHIAYIPRPLREPWFATKQNSHWQGVTQINITDNFKIGTGITYKKQVQG